MLNDHRFATVTDEDQTYVKTGHFLERYRRFRRGQVFVPRDVKGAQSKEHGGSDRNSDAKTPLGKAGAKDGKISQVP